MTGYLAFLALLLPFTALSLPLNATTPIASDFSSTAVSCSAFPLLCPSDTFVPLADRPDRTNHPDDTHRFKPYPPSINIGLTPSTASGDVLNTTRCYCASPYWQDDHTYGYYYLLSYYNFHHDSSFTFDITCKSPQYTVKSSHHHHDDMLVPECLRQRHHEKWCTSADNRGEVGNTFCYEFTGNGESDEYRFNRQKRDVPSGATFRESEDATLGICGGYCENLVGGLQVLDGEALTAVDNGARGVGKSTWSAILAFGDTDDMCEECK